MSSIGANPKPPGGPTWPQRIEDRIDGIEGMVHTHAITLAEHHKDLTAHSMADDRLAQAIEKLAKQLDWRNQIRDWLLFMSIVAAVYGFAKH